MGAFGEIAKMLKLGGRQRSRYRSALAAYFGHDLPADGAVKPATAKPKTKAAPSMKVDNSLISGWYQYAQQMADQNHSVMPILDALNTLEEKNTDDASSLDLKTALFDLKSAIKESGANAMGGSYPVLKGIQDEIGRIDLAGKKAAAALPAPEYNPHDVTTWPQISASKPLGKKIKVASIGMANKLVQGGGNNPQAAKANVQEQLTARMDGQFPLEKLSAVVLDTKYQHSVQITTLAQAAIDHKNDPEFWKNHALRKDFNGNWSMVSGSTANPPKEYNSQYVGVGKWILEPTQEQVEHALQTTIVNSMVKLWAQTSNDNNPRSLAMQLAAQDEFGLKDTYPWPADPTLQANVDEEYSKHGDFHRSFLRAMHNNTQDWAKANGITHLRLRRGVKSPPPGTHSGYGAGAPGVGTEMQVQLRPMSSFSSSMTIAKRFGFYRMESVVPVEWVIGTAATGFGCHGEYEWVVLGGTHDTKRIS
jgi:hypothetical protein